MSNPMCLYFNHRTELMGMAEVPKLDLTQVEKDIVKVSYLEKEMTPQMLIDSLDAFLNYVVSASNSTDSTTKVHPKTRTPIRKGHDFITVFKRTCAEYLNMLKEQESCKTGSLFDLWLIPLCEEYRFQDKEKWAESVASHIYHFQTMIFDDYFGNPAPPDDQMIESKQRLMRLSGRKHIAGIASKRIIRDRMLNGSKTIN